MAGTFIDALPAVSAAQLTDVFPVDQLPGPITYQESNAQLLALFEANITITDSNFTGTLSPTHGGTGINNGSSTLTLGGNLTTSGAFNSVFTMTAATNVTFPTSGTLATTSSIPSLPLSLANGGTGAGLTASAGSIVYSGASALALTAAGTSGQLLSSAGTGTPSWTTATYPSTTTINQVLYSSSSNVVGGITAADNGVMISGTTGIPSWLANSGTPGYVLTANSSAPASWQAISASGAITTIDGDSGSVTPSSGTITISGGTTGLTTSGTSATLNLTGTLNLAGGGTNHALTASAGGIVWSDASKLNILAGTSVAGQLLLSGNAATPNWSTSTYPSTNAANTLLYASSANTMAALATATTAVLTTSSSVPTWAATLSLALGGTGASLTGSAGGIFYINVGSVGAILAGTGTANKALLSGSNAAPSWSAYAFPSTLMSSGLMYANSSTSLTTLSPTTDAVLTSDGSGNPSWKAVTDGQVIIGSSIGIPAAATITASTGITITNGHNTITIATNGADHWVDQSSSPVTMTTNTGYTSDDASSLVTFTLPTTSAIGDFVEIVGKGSGLWKIAQAAGQQIQISPNSTTSGATGYLASVNQYDAVKLRCDTANTIWSVVSQQSTGLTVN